LRSLWETNQWKRWPPNANKVEENTYRVVKEGDDDKGGYHPYFETRCGSLIPFIPFIG